MLACRPRTVAPRARDRAAREQSAGARVPCAIYMLTHDASARWSILFLFVPAQSVVCTRCLQHVRRYRRRNIVPLLGGLGSAERAIDLADAAHTRKYTMLLNLDTAKTSPSSSGNATFRVFRLDGLFAGPGSGARYEGERLAFGHFDVRMRHSDTRRSEARRGEAKPLRATLPLSLARGADRIHVHLTCTLTMHGCGGAGGGERAGSAAGRRGDHRTRPAGLHARGAPPHRMPPRLKRKPTAPYARHPGRTVSPTY